MDIKLKRALAKSVCEEAEQSIKEAERTIEYWLEVKRNQAAIIEAMHEWICK